MLLPSGATFDLLGRFLTNSGAIHSRDTVSVQVFWDPVLEHVRADLDVYMPRNASQRMFMVKDTILASRRMDTAASRGQYHHQRSAKPLPIKDIIHSIRDLIDKG